jgi:hypothetical protein
MAAHGRNMKRTCRWCTGMHFALHVGSEELNCPLSLSLYVREWVMKIGSKGVSDWPGGRCIYGLGCRASKQACTRTYVQQA